MKYYNQGVRDVIKYLRTSINDGLDTDTANKRLSLEGENSIEEEKRTSIIVRFLGQFKDFMVIILIIAAIISIFTEIYSGGNNFTDSIVICGIVFFNAIIGTLQEIKADNAIEALKALTTPETTVIRDGNLTAIESKNIVRGDIVLLEPGDIVPADCRVIEETALKADESPLTGESAGVEKFDCLLDEDTALADRVNMLYMGTSIVQGHCKAVVTETGRCTEMGRISAMLNGKSSLTPLQKKLNRLGKQLGMGAIIICTIIFLTGILRGFSVFNMFMMAVSLAVAAIPEGLGAVVTIVLAIGVQRLAERKAIVKQLSAVEALGNATVICSDKTGTITENKMSLTHYDSDETLSLACLCCDADSEKGEATELGIVRGGKERGMDKEVLEKTMPRVYEIPFSSQRRRMTTVHKYKSDYIAICKGAPEEIVAICSKVRGGEVIERAESFAKKGLRVLAVAKKTSSTIVRVERGFTFVGLIALEDKPRKGVRESVELCRNAGIRTIMITGDNKVTATAVAESVGISTKAMTGSELTNMDSNSIDKCVNSCSVFARVTPEDKYRLVNSLKKQGEIVAFAGDGINDAPSIKLADIGCAMGENGTEVARQAADIVLADDNFNTIVSAIKEGRGIYENILKVIHFLLSSNIGEILVIFLAVIMGFDVPLLPVQLLWVNLVTDSLPAVSLGLDKTDCNITNNSSSFGDKKMWFSIGTEGVMIGALALLAFAIGNTVFGSMEIGRTMCFCVLSISQLVHAFNMRSAHSILNKNICSNIYLVGALIVGITLQWLVVEPEFVRGIFGTTALGIKGWITVFALSIVPIIVCETEKRVES